MGVNIFLTVMLSSKTAVSPTYNSLAMPTPPFTINAPVLTLLLAVTASTYSSPLVLMLPVTSNASAGAKLLIPTFVLESNLKTVLVDPASFTLKSMLAPDVL